MPVCDQFNWDASLEFHFFAFPMFGLVIQFLPCNQSSAHLFHSWQSFFPLCHFFLWRVCFHPNVCSSAELNIGTSNFQFNYQRPRFNELKSLEYFRYQSSLMKFHLPLILSSQSAENYENVDISDERMTKPMIEGKKRAQNRQTKINENEWKSMQYTQTMLRTQSNSNSRVFEIAFKLLNGPQFTDANN